MKQLSGTIILVGMAVSLAVGEVRAADLVGTDIEVTQTIQDLENNVRLVAKKNTWVRIHAHCTGATKVDGVVARLTVRRTAPGPVTLLGTLDSPPTTVVATPNRVSVAQAFNLQIPYAWRSGTIELTAQIDFPNDIAEDQEANNTLKTTVSFESVPPIRVRVYGVEAPGVQLPAQTHYDHLASWLRRAFPTSALLLETSSLKLPLNLGNDVCLCPKDPNDNCIVPSQCQNDAQRSCNADTDCGCARVNELLLQRRMFDKVNADDFAEDRRYVGMVDDVGGTKFMRGCSPGVEAKVAAGPTGTDNWGWDNDGSYGDWYTSHELGHTYGRPHAGCCGAQNPGPYPYPNCEIGDDTQFGFDTDGPKVRSYHGRDNMSYCTGQWLSDFTFEAVMDQLILEHGAPPPPLKVLGNFAIAIGTANLSLDKAKISILHQLPPTRAYSTAASGDWEFRFLDASGGILSRHAFTPVEMEDERDLVLPSMTPSGGTPARLAVFSELIEVPDGPVARLALYHGGIELDGRDASGHAPTVTILSPNGGQSLGRSATIQWSASDADGDPLTATVLYSADGGANWHAVASDVATTSADVDLLGLPGGSQALFRVLVSDGFYSAVDDSDGVMVVENEAPQAYILDPGDGAQVAMGQVAMLEGLAHDAEDGALDEGALVWSSDRQGTLGLGAHLEIGDELVPGTHVITLTATDSGGESATATLTILKGSTDADGCPAYPRDDCDAASRAALSLRDRTGQRKLALRLMRGDVARDGSAFGTPNAGTTETLCLYAGGRLRDAVAIGPSATLWRANGARGFRYSNPDADGVTRMQLKAGGTTRPLPAMVTVRGEGASLPNMAAALGLPVVAQVGNDVTTVCVSADFGPEQVQKNERGGFRAKR